MTRQLFFVILVSVFLASLGLVYISHSSSTTTKLVPVLQRVYVDPKQVYELIAHERPQEALKIAQDRLKKIPVENTDEIKQWKLLVLESAEQIPDLDQLKNLYEQSPKLIEQRERASLLLADDYLKHGQIEKFRLIRENWKRREKIPEAWFYLDADFLTANLQHNEAIAFLNSQSFPGKVDSGRLMRLALLHIMIDPKIAWNYLNEAMQKDPNNPDILVYRANILEAADKIEEAGHEYQTALQAAPENLQLKYKAIEFYIRNKRFSEASQLLNHTLPHPSSEQIWPKAIFWSKIAMPFAFDWRLHQPPSGNLKPLIDFLIDLKPYQFWDVQLFKKVPNGKAYLQQEQATFWLRLFSAIQLKQEKEALRLLENNVFQRESWNPPLELALMRILTYRQKGYLHLGAKEAEMQKLAGSKPSSPLSLFIQLEKLAHEEFISPHSHVVSPKMHALLNSPEIFTLSLVSAGWQEAALNLHR